MASTYRTSAGDMLDAICWAHYGVQAGAVEAVLDDAGNRGLAEAGPIYPAGLLITLPDLPQVTGASAAVQPVRLWQ